MGLSVCPYDASKISCTERLRIPSAWSPRRRAFLASFAPSSVRVGGYIVPLVHRLARLRRPTPSKGVPRCPGRALPSWLRTLSRPDGSNSWARVARTSRCPVRLWPLLAALAAGAEGPARAELEQAVGVSADWALAAAADVVGLI